MSLRKVFRASVFIKKSPVFKKYLCTNHARHAKTIEYEKRPISIESTNEDKISEEINTSSFTKILLVLENNEKFINGSHLVLAMKKFHKLCRTNLRNEEYVAKAMEIYSLINSNIDKLSVTESVKLLIICYKMKALGSTKVMKSLLNHINNYINELTLVDFRKISVVLKQMPDSTLTKDLLGTLEKRFIIQVATELDLNNIDHLESALYFTAYNLDNEKFLRLFINGLNDYKTEIPSNIAISIFHSLCAIKQYPKGWINLLEKIQNILIENIDELSDDQILFVLYLIGEKCRLDRMEEFYNERLCKVLVKKIITSDSGFETALSALKSLSYIRFVNIELLNYTCAAYFERKNLSSEIVEEEFFKLMTLTSNLAALKHKTIFFDEIKDSMLNNKLLLNCNYETLCILALNLINLDCYPNKLLRIVFDGKSNYSEHNTFLNWTFCKVYQKIKTNPTYNGPMPSESQMVALKQFFYQRNLRRKKLFNDKISCYLEKGMGGPIFVKSNMSSKLFHLIDHAVAFSKDGSPIPINADTNIGAKLNIVNYVEDLKVPPESQIVLILIMPSFWFSRNTKELYSTYSITIETLEAMSYVVVDINEATWNETPAEEKTDMLMSKIRSKLKLD